MPKSNHGDERSLADAIDRCRERNVIIPTFAQMKDPSRIPAGIVKRLRLVAMNDVDPVNLFRISWKNEAVDKGGGFNLGNWLEFPSALTGVSARIVGLVGRHFPTGAHKVGAAFGCLVPRLVSGEFNPARQKAVWPSTGNFCRGGAFDCALLGCAAVAILPEQMSQERFDWLESIGAEVIRTKGCESNVKEIYDACWDIRRTRPDCVIFNQFEEFGNAVWHYHVTGSIVEEVFHQVAGPGDRLAAFVSATGSAGTISAGDYLRTAFASLRVVAVEALQCPTLLRCGFGGHRIEGIGDKHVPWIHNVRNTDVVCAVDDEQCLAVMRLFNEQAGRRFLESHGTARAAVDSLDCLGISSICNLIAAIKTARHFEMDGRDVLFVPLTDSMSLYDSRMNEQRREKGAYTDATAAHDFARHMESITTDHMRELRYDERKALHNLKYFTWVEQQQREVRDLDRIWDPDFWSQTFQMVEPWDQLIVDFNRRVGVSV